MKIALVTLLTASSVYGIAIDSFSVAPALAGDEDGQAARPNATTPLDGQATPQVNATTLVKRSLSIDGQATPQVNATTLVKRSFTTFAHGPQMNATAAALDGLPGVNATTLVPNTVLDGPAAAPGVNATVAAIVTGLVKREPQGVVDGPAAVPATNATSASTSFIDGQATPQGNATTDN